MSNIQENDIEIDAFIKYEGFNVINFVIECKNVSLY